MKRFVLIVLFAAGVAFGSLMINISTSYWHSRSKTSTVLSASSFVITGLPNDKAISFYVQETLGQSPPVLSLLKGAGQCMPGTHDVPPFAVGTVCVQDGKDLSQALRAAGDVLRKTRLDRLRKECGADGAGSHQNMRDDCPTILDI